MGAGRAWVRGWRLERRISIVLVGVWLCCDCGRGLGGLYVPWDGSLG